jgi:S1-C subfamily serine protease
MKDFLERIRKNQTVIAASAISGAIAAVIIVVIAVAFLEWGGGRQFVSAIGGVPAVATSTPNASLAAGENAVVSTVAKANPSVVSIVISKDVPTVERRFERFGPFSMSVPEQNGGSQEEEVGGGSGFIVSPDGLVVTNKHVVSDKNASYTVFTNDGQKYDVDVVAEDPFYDIAILRIKSDKTFPYLTFANSDNIQLGQTAIAIGNALAEFRNSVSVGVISGLSRSVTAGDDFGSSETLDQAIQTDAPINPGNSGGPLLNSSGQVVGVNVALVEGSENIGFALPGNIAKSAVDSVEKTGSIERPYLGVRTIDITPDLAEQEHLAVDHGELVTGGTRASEAAVVSNSPASAAGIKEGDIILQVDGVNIDDTHTLGELVREHNIGDTVSITLNRAGKQMTLRAVLAKAPQDIAS